MRYLLILSVIVGISGCGESSLSPETRENIERNSLDPSTAVDVQHDGSPMRIVVNKSRTVAMVSGVPFITTYADMEAAVSRYTGCRTEAPRNSDGSPMFDRSAPISEDQFRRSGGTIPVLLRC